MSDKEQQKPTETSTGLWCPQCARPVKDPLVCGDCASVICRVCGTVLEDSDEMAFG